MGKNDSGGAEAKSAEAKRKATYAFDPQEIFVYQPLLDQLDDEVAYRREVAAWLLGELRYKSANKPISRMLTHDDDPLVRLGAAQALEKIGDSWSVQAIIRGLKDDDELVREMCIHALIKLHDKQAIYPLEQLAKRESVERVRNLAQEALRLISGKPKKQSTAWERKLFKYLRIVELEPGNANAHYNLAVSYFHARRFKMSRKYCEQARELGANVDFIDEKLRQIENPSEFSKKSDDDVDGADDPAEDVSVEQSPDDEAVLDKPPPPQPGQEREVSGES